MSLIREKTRVKFVDCVCNNGNELPLLFTEEPSIRRKPRRRETSEERRKIATSISFTNIAVVGALFASSILLLLFLLLL